MLHGITVFPCFRNSDALWYKGPRTAYSMFMTFWFKEKSAGIPVLCFRLFFYWSENTGTIKTVEVMKID
jgi:hypothetical protein